MREVPLAELPSLAGTELGVSNWLEITQDRINRFADATGDHQWIHVDIERATRELGAPIAHGYLIVSLIPMLAKNIVAYQGVGRGVNYGSNKVRFTNVVPVGARVRLKLKLKQVEHRAGAMQLTSECTIEIEHADRPACVAEIVSLLYAA